MTTTNLAKIERVDLKEAWPHEAHDFTPWLAKNIDQLGEALGMDLELQQTEAAVGSFSLDIFATDRNQSRPVIIENQLDATNHTHLGQLLTYAAGFDANVIVWLTKEFRDEHRQALDWLNQRTGEDTQFFGVVVELLRIGDSPLAPQFRLVAAPNQWGKKTTKPPVSERSERYRVFFQALIEILREQKFTTARNSRDRSWFSFNSGYRGTSYGAAFTLQKQARVELYIDVGSDDQNIELLEALESQKEEIELAIGETVDWQRLDNRRACRVALDRPGSIDDDDATRAEIRDWMAENLIKFKKAFDLRLKSILGNQSLIQEQPTFE